MKINMETIASFLTILVAGVVGAIGVLFFPENIMNYFLLATTIFFGIGIAIFLGSLIADKIMEEGI